MNRSMEDAGTRKGVIAKLFGVIMIILGIMDTMLAWRGGFAVNDFYIALIACGIFFYFIGAVRGYRNDSSSRGH